MRCSDRDRGGGGGGGGDLSASSKHRTTGHTLRLCMELQTAVYLHILFDTCAILLRGAPLLILIDHEFRSLYSPDSWPTTVGAHQLESGMYMYKQCSY